MNYEILVVALAVLSALTTLATEAVKKIMSDFKVSVYPNVLAAAVSAVVTVIATVCYVLIVNEPVTGHLIGEAIALVFLSWLCSMLGYDKVKQMIEQIAK